MLLVASNPSSRCFAALSSPETGALVGLFFFTTAIRPNTLSLKRLPVCLSLQASTYAGYQQGAGQTSSAQQTGYGASATGYGATTQGYGAQQVTSACSQLIA